jgi:hypothetical protein
MARQRRRPAIWVEATRTTQPGALGHLRGAERVRDPGAQAVPGPTRRWVNRHDMPCRFLEPRKPNLRAPSLTRSRRVPIASAVARFASPEEYASRVLRPPRRGHVLGPDPIVQQAVGQPVQRRRQLKRRECRRTSRPTAAQGCFRQRQAPVTRTAARRSATAPPRPARGSGRARTGTHSITPSETHVRSLSTVTMKQWPRTAGVGERQSPPAHRVPAD